MVETKKPWSVANDKRKCFIPHPGVNVNGQLWLGRCDLTYTEFSEAMAMLSARAQHEMEQRFGIKDAQKVLGLQAAFGGAVEVY